MAIEIVSFPMKNGGSFHSFLSVYQRVKCHHKNILLAASKRSWQSLPQQFWTWKIHTSKGQQHPPWAWTTHKWVWPNNNAYNIPTLCWFISIYIYIYMCVCVYVCIYMHLYIYINYISRLFEIMFGSHYAMAMGLETDRYGNSTHPKHFPQPSPPTPPLQGMA